MCVQFILKLLIVKSLNFKSEDKIGICFNLNGKRGSFLKVEVDFLNLEDIIGHISKLGDIFGNTFCDRASCWTAKNNTLVIKYFFYCIRLYVWIYYNKIKNNTCIKIVNSSVLSYKYSFLNTCRIRIQIKIWDKIMYRYNKCFCGFDSQS